MRQHRVHMSRREYREVYLKSDEWRNLRATILKTNPKCERCLTPANDIHHLVYRDDVQSAKVTDLMPLCRHCHNQIHRAITLGLLPNPSRIHHNMVLKARQQSQDIEDREITEKQSYNQTKRNLTESEFDVICSLHPHAKKRVCGILKCLSDRLLVTRFTNKRIDMALGFIHSVSTDKGLSKFTAGQHAHAKRARRRENKRRR